MTCYVTHSCFDSLYHLTNGQRCTLTRNLLFCLFSSYKLSGALCNNVRSVCVCPLCLSGHPLLPLGGGRGMLSRCLCFCSLSRAFAELRISSLVDPPRVSVRNMLLCFAADQALCSVCSCHKALFVAVHGACLPDTPLHGLVPVKYYHMLSYYIHIPLFCLVVPVQM